MQKVFIEYTSCIDKRPHLVCHWGWVARQAWDSSCLLFFFLPVCVFFFLDFWHSAPATQVGVCIGTERQPAFPRTVWSGARAAAAAVERPAGKMMEEVSIMVAYDAHVFSQLHDEDFLTGLVAISKPRSMVGLPRTPPRSWFVFLSMVAVLL